MARRRLILLLAALLALAGSAAMLSSPYRALFPAYHRLYYTPARYQAALAAHRAALAPVAAAGDAAAAADLLRRGVTEEAFPYWRGTRWAFSGTTQTPGQGRIACGYFVTTVLRDLGVPVQRAKYAQMASEAMIRELVADANVARYSRAPIADFAASVAAKGDHLYVVGLDNHTGFLAVEGGAVSFLHASGRWPWAVVREDALSSRVLTDSQYRVTGCLTCDSGLLNRWMNAVKPGT